MCGGVELGEAQPEPVVALGERSPDEDRRRQLGQLRRRDRIGIGAGIAQPDEIRVRVDHHHPQARLEEQPLEHDAERVGLPRARLPAEERVPVEAGGVDAGRHRVGTTREDRADHELGRVGAGPCQLRDLGARRALDQGVHERSPVAGEQHSRPLDETHLDGRLEVERPVTGQALPGE